MSKCFFSVPSSIVLQRLLCFMLCHSDWAWERGGEGGQREKGYREKDYLSMHPMSSPQLTGGRKQTKANLSRKTPKVSVYGSVCTVQYVR